MKLAKALGSLRKFLCRYSSVYRSRCLLTSDLRPLRSSPFLHPVADVGANLSLFCIRAIRAVPWLLLFASILICAFSFPALAVTPLLLFFALCDLIGPLRPPWSNLLLLPPPDR